MREIGQKSAQNQKYEKEKSLENVVFSRLFGGGGCEIRTHVRLPSNGFQELEIVSRFGAISSLNLPDFPEKKPFLRPFPDIPWKFARKMRENNQKHYGSNATE